MNTGSNSRETMFSISTTLSLQEAVRQTGILPGSTWRPSDCLLEPQTTLGAIGATTHCYHWPLECLFLYFLTIYLYEKACWRGNFIEDVLDITQIYTTIILLNIYSNHADY